MTHERATVCGAMASSPSSSATDRVISAARNLSHAVGKLEFAEPVAFVYNPLDYAWAAHEQYLQKLPDGGTKVLFLGMNPGPWGMTQTGVPFGEVNIVRDWLRIDAPILQPACEHPKRPVEGLGCKRSEVSGMRLWGLFRDRFGTAAKFFCEHFVANYCPLVFMEASARNRTPDKLPIAEREALTALCDAHLAEVVAAVAPKFAVGVGAYAEACLQRIGCDAQVLRILHPSPASPAANRGWGEAVTQQLIAAGVWKS